MKTLRVNYSGRHNWRAVSLLVPLIAVALFVCFALESGHPSYAIWIYVAVLSASATGRVEMNETTIRLKSFTDYQLRWDEIERVEMPATNSREMVFYGKDKVLSMAGPDRWKGDEKAAMIELCNQQIESRGIPLLREITFKSYPSQNIRLKPPTQGTLRVDMPFWYRLMPWLGAFFVVGMLLYIFTISESSAIWPRLPHITALTAITIYFYLTVGHLEMNETFIRHTSRLGCFQMAWDEIERIETSDTIAMISKEGKQTLTDYNYETWAEMVLYSKAGRLAISGFPNWSGADKAAMIELFNRKVNERPIEAQPNRWAMHKLSKGTRVKAETETTQSNR